MKKKRPGVVLLLVLCLMLTYLGMAEPASAATVANNYKVVSGPVTVRSEPKDTAAVLGTLPQNKHIYVLEVTSDKWCRLKFNGKKGWVPYSSLKKISLDGTSYVVTANDAKAYAESDGSGKVLATYKKGDKVTLYEVNESWGKTIVDGYYGYVKMWRLEKATSDSPSAGKQDSANIEKNKADGNSSTAAKPGSGSQSSSDNTASGSDYQVNNSYLNIRSGPSTKYDKLGTLNRDDVITIVEQKDGWGRFTYRDQAAWILMSYMKKYTAPAGSENSSSGANQSPADQNDAASGTPKQGKPGWHLSNNIWEYYNDNGSLKFASNGMHKAWGKINGGTSSTDFYIVVDTAACETYIFKKGTGKSWIPYKKFICSPGKPSTPTRKGTFTIKNKGYSFGGSNYTCYYYSQFYGGYLFHSVLYNRGTFQIRDGRLGQQLSHGCVRLSLDNAKWIQDKMPTGTKVLVY